MESEQPWLQQNQTPPTPNPTQQNTYQQPTQQNPNINQQTVNANTPPAQPINNQKEEKKGHKLIIIVIIIIILLFLAIPISLVVVGLSLQVMDSGSGVPEASVKAYWKSAEPLAIVDWAREGTNLTIIFRNNTYETITLNEFNLSSGTPYIGEDILAAGATKNIQITGLEPCSKNNKFSIIKMFYF